MLIYIVILESVGFIAILIGFFLGFKYTEPCSKRSLLGCRVYSYVQMVLTCTYIHIHSSHFVAYCMHVMSKLDSNINIHLLWSVECSYSSSRVPCLGQRII